MSSARLSRRVGAFDILGCARLPEYRHLFNKHGSDDTAKGNIQPDGGQQVHGALYQLSAEQTAILDRYEGGYQRLWIEVMSERGSMRALTYEAIRLSDRLEPTHDYLHHYVRGAREHGLPNDYLRAILPSWFELSH
jgi:hypothetical protein